MSITDVRDKINLILEDETDVEALIQFYLSQREIGHNHNVAVEQVLSGQRLDGPTLRAFHTAIDPYETRTGAEIKAQRAAAKTAALPKTLDEWFERLGADQKAAAEHPIMMYKTAMNRGIDHEEETWRRTLRKMGAPI